MEITNLILIHAISTDLREVNKLQMERSKLSENGTSAGSPTPVPGTAPVSGNIINGTNCVFYICLYNYQIKQIILKTICCHQKGIYAVQLNYNLDINLFYITIKTS